MVGKGIGAFAQIYDIFKVLGIAVIYHSSIFNLQDNQKKIEKWIF